MLPPGDVRNCMVALNAVGLLVFFALPVAPPRLLPGARYHDTVALSGFGTTHDGALPAAQTPQHCQLVIDAPKTAD